MNRRNFIKKSAFSATSATILASVPHKAPAMDEDKKFVYRTLGKTGLKLPVISMGVMLLKE